MQIIDVIILSLVEGVTEFLPVSSTGHLIILSKWLNLDYSAFTSSFNIAIQLGAILAVVVLYGRRLWQSPKLWLKVGLAFIPTAVIGLGAYSLVKNYLLHSLTITALALGLGGVLIIWFEYWYKRHRHVDVNFNQLTYQQAFWLGLAQALAIVPGVSRSGATILAGLWMGLPRVTVVEFSFLLAIPTMTAATGYDLYKSAGDFKTGEWPLLILGFVLSFATAWVTVKWLLKFIKTHDFTVFGAYRVGLAVLLWWLLLG